VSVKQGVLVKKLVPPFGASEHQSCRTVLRQRFIVSKSVAEMLRGREGFGEVWAAMLDEEENCIAIVTVIVHL